MKKPLVGSQEMQVPASDVAAISDTVVLSEPLDNYAQGSAPASKPLSEPPDAAPAASDAKSAGSDDAQT